MVGKVFGGGVSVSGSGSGSKTGLKDMRSDLRAVWARDTLGLSEGAYRELCFHISVSFRFVSGKHVPSFLSVVFHSIQTFIFRIWVTRTDDDNDVNHKSI